MRAALLALLLCAGCTVNLYPERVVVHAREGVALSTSYALVGKVENHLHKPQAAQLLMIESVDVTTEYHH